jgi:tetratricopeptide (TPR) repeat protein
MEEDYGNLTKVKEILKQGIHYNPMNENLIIKFLRVEEKFGRIEESRKILSKLKHSNIEKSWKLYLEGALLEAKLGNPKTAQRVFKMLLKNLEMQGNVYLEYAKFEENMGNLLGALKISYEGLSKNIRFSNNLELIVLFLGNLWGYFARICERIVEKTDYIPLDNYLSVANECLPKDMLWKIYLEIAGVAERKNDYFRSKNFITKAILSCPENVKWKCFVLGARMELKDQYYIKAKKIINRFIENANEKQKYHLLIESSKISEYLGDLNSAVSYFEDTKDYMRTEWKVYLEYIHMLTRNSQYEQAYQVAKESLYHHNLAGRLWASLIQLKHIAGHQIPGTEAYKIFLIAINEVPKSGEVWCEGARVCLNPHSDRFDINKAKQFLNFAIYFTPQYGDSFVEAIRLYTLLGDKKELASLKKV